MSINNDATTLRLRINTDGSVVGTEFSQMRMPGAGPKGDKGEPGPAGPSTVYVDDDGFVVATLGDAP